MTKKKSGPLIRSVPLADLKPDPNNARTHSERNLAAIVGSLQRFGQVEPLVVQRGTGMIIGGNGRYEAMKALGLTTVDVAEIEIGDREAAALSLALNRTAELAGWDYQALGDVVRDLMENGGLDMATIGWSADDLSPILAAQWVPPEIIGDIGKDHDRGGGESADDQPRAASNEDGGAAGTRPGFAAPVAMTVEQRGIFDEAASRVRDICDDQAISDGKCLELICADYLASKAA